MDLPDRPGRLALPLPVLRDRSRELREIPATPGAPAPVACRRRAAALPDDLGTLPEATGVARGASGGAVPADADLRETGPGGAAAPGTIPGDREASRGERLEDLAERLEATGAYRVSRRLDLARERLVGAAGSARTAAVAVDVVTDAPAGDAILALRLRPCLVDGNGRVASLGAPSEWLEDPGAPLRHAVRRATGLTDPDLRGRRIDDRAAVDALRAADVRVAFDASTVRAMVERRLPTLRGLPWACARDGVDWERRGFGADPRPLAWLLAQARWFEDGPRVGADAVVAMLCHEDAGGCPAFTEMLAAAGVPGWRTAMLGASFDRTADVQTRGYRWRGTRRVWWRGEADRVDGDLRGAGMGGPGPDDLAREVGHG